MHTICCIIVLYTYLITHFGDVTNGVDTVIWSVVFICNEACLDVDICHNSLGAYA